jgi:hypothetical protein
MILILFSGGSAQNLLHYLNLTRDPPLSEHDYFALLYRGGEFRAQAMCSNIPCGDSPEKLLLEL